MKKAGIAALISIFLASSALAADGVPPPAKGPGPNFEQHKAEIVKRIDERLSRNQEEKTCVQAAKTPEEIRACQERFKAEVKEQRQEGQRPRLRQ